MAVIYLKCYDSVLMLTIACVTIYFLYFCEPCLTCTGLCSYGATSSGKVVDAAGLQLLENMGFERALAAEALKQVSPASLYC